MRKGLGWVAGLLVAGCVSAPAKVPQQAAVAVQPPPQLPDTLGFGVHVLALGASPRRELWVGTYGNGIYVQRRGARTWEHLTAADSNGISWDFVNSFAFTADTAEVWYGTVGNGFGVSHDGGRTWRNWQFRQLGPEYQYVVPDGIRVHDGVVYIATADGLRISENGGETWRCIGAADGVKAGAAERPGACSERVASLPSEYLLSIDVARDGTVWLGHVKGMSYSRDRGRTWTDAGGEGLPARVRDILVRDSAVWAVTEAHVLRDTTMNGRFVIADPDIAGMRGLPGAPRDLVAPQPMGGAQVVRARTELPPRGQENPARPRSEPMLLTSNGAVLPDATGRSVVHFQAAGERFRPASDLWAGIWYGSGPLAGSSAGLQRVLAGEAPYVGVPAGEIAQPVTPMHVWFRRPINDSAANPFIDGTYRYGSTMGGNFQQHQGVEFNNAAGTPVRAVGDGVVVFAGGAEAGANTVAILHDRRWEGQYVFTTYYHNSSLNVKAGQRVRAGDIVSFVGNTGRATNDHLHLEVHVAPTADSARIINAAERFPPYTVNPQLWIEPVPGTGIVAGRVFDAAGKPVPGARIYGLVVMCPEETPFAFAETYRDRAHSDPAYGDHFAVGDVVPGDYLLGVRIGDAIAWRRARVAAGMVTFVEFRP